MSFLHWCPSPIRQDCVDIPLAKPTSRTTIGRTKATDLRDDILTICDLIEDDLPERLIPGYAKTITRDAKATAKELGVVSRNNHPPAIEAVLFLLEERKTRTESIITHITAWFGQQRIPNDLSAKATTCLDDAARFLMVLDTASAELKRRLPTPNGPRLNLTHYRSLDAIPEFHNGLLGTLSSQRLLFSVLEEAKTLPQDHDIDEAMLLADYAFAHARNILDQADTMIAAWRCQSPSPNQTLLLAAVIATLDEIRRCMLGLRSEQRKLSLMTEASGDGIRVH